MLDKSRDRYIKKQNENKLEFGVTEEIDFGELD